MIRYDAKEGMFFDWAKPLYIGVDENGNLVKHFLGVKTLFIGPDDSIDNYIEVSESNVVVVDEFATAVDYEIALAELGVQ